MATVWLAGVLVVVEACYLGIPAGLALTNSSEYLRSVAAISYVEVVFAAALWLCGRVALAAVGSSRLASRLVLMAFVTLAALSCVYAPANVIMFAVFGGFLRCELLAHAAVAAPLTKDPVFRYGTSSRQGRG